VGSKPLEDLIRQMAAKGELTHLSLIPAAGGQWSASFTPASVFGSNQFTAADPIAALTTVLEWKPSRRAARAPDENPWE
jgi:hypothetical protein